MGFAMLREACMPVTEEGEIMATRFRILSKLIGGLFGAPATNVASEGETGSPAAPMEKGSPVAPVPAKTMTLPAFVACVRQDATLRTHFAQNPSTVLQEFGIDPTPYNLLSQLTDAQLDRLMADWSHDAGATTPATTQPSRPALVKSVQTPVYGPPPGFPKWP
jgi:hypothetical protein